MYIGGTVFALLSRWILFGRRKEHVESGPFVDFALHPNVSPALFDDSIDGRQTQSGTLAFFLGREEGLENMWQILRFYPRPRITDGQHHVGAGLHSGVRPRIGRGKVHGGSSGINYMAYVRGHPGDFDSWAADGATGWSYDDVLPYFKKSEVLAPSGDIVVDADALALGDLADRGSEILARGDDRVLAAVRAATEGLLGEKREVLERTLRGRTEVLA